MTEKIQEHIQFQILTGSNLSINPKIIKNYVFVNSSIGVKLGESEQRFVKLLESRLSEKYNHEC